jgi:hypothetical protein
LNQALSFTPKASQKSKTAFSASDEFRRLFNDWLEAILPPLLPTPTAGRLQENISKEIFP